MNFAEFNYSHKTQNQKIYQEYPTSGCSYILRRTCTNKNFNTMFGYHPINRSGLSVNDVEKVEN